jgi:hypothetical protein
MRKAVLALAAALALVFAVAVAWCLVRMDRRLTELEKPPPKPPEHVVYLRR